MSKTHIDELVTYPAKVIQLISSDPVCVGLIIDKSPKLVTDIDFDTALDNNLFNYQYVDKTTDVAAAYIWVEAEIPSVTNTTIKNMTIYVTVACHKSYMKLDTSVFRGYLGNRRDNLVRYIDKLLQQSDIFGIGALKLVSVYSQETSNGSFTGRLLTYTVPDFNMRDINEVRLL